MHQSNDSDADQPMQRAAIVAARQHGVLTRRQASAAGLTEPQIRTLVRKGTLEDVTRKVLRSTAAPRTPESEAWAALLDLGELAALCRDSMLGLYRVAGFALAPVHVVVPRPRRSGLVEPARLHTSTQLPDEHLTVVGGMLGTTPARTVLDMAATVHPQRLERIVDRLWAQGLLLPSELVWMADGWGAGRRNADVLRRIAAERGDQEHPPESNTESRLQQVLRDAGQRPLRPQVTVGGDRIVGRIDFVDDMAPFLLEVQSSLYHGSLTDRRRDAERLAELRRLGYEVMEVWEDRVWHDGPALAAEIARRRAESRRHQRAA